MHFFVIYILFWELVHLTSENNFFFMFAYCESQYNLVINQLNAQILVL